MGLRILSYSMASRLQTDLEAYNPLCQRTFVSFCGFRITYPVEVKGVLGKLTSLISNIALNLLSEIASIFFSQHLIRPEEEYIQLDLRELSELVRKEEESITRDASAQKIRFYETMSAINFYISSKFDDAEKADQVHLLNETVSKTRIQELIETQESLLKKLDIGLGYSVACQELKTLYHKVLASSFNPEEKKTLKVAIFQKFAVNLRAFIREDNPQISDDGLFLRLKDEYDLSHGIDPHDSSLLRAEISKTLSAKSLFFERVCV